MQVCVCACVHAYVRACMCACMITSSVRSFTCVRACMHACVHTKCTYVRMYVNVHAFDMQRVLLSLVNLSKEDDRSL